MVKPDTHESLPYLLYHSTKLLCAECRDVLPVIDFRPSVKTAVLSCGHTRILTLELRLPITVGSLLSHRAVCKGGPSCSPE
jgi:hypothetical protein